MTSYESIFKEKAKILSGNVLLFGNMSEKIIDILNKNDNVLSATLLGNITNSLNEIIDEKNKKVSYKNIRKMFKKKNINTVMAIYSDLDEYKYKFVSDSVVLSKEKIYLYIDKNEDIEKIKNYFLRYNVSITDIKCKGGLILEINLDNKKINRFKEKKYLICDKICSFYNICSDLFIS